MDAERMLNELIGNANVAGYLTASDQSPNENFRKVYALRIQILPLVRFGLVMKRLEDFVKQGRDINTADIRHAGDGLGGFCVQLKHGYPARKVCKSSVSSLYEAINTALDAAGVE